MQILIVGLNHQIQAAEIKSWGSGGQPQAFEKEQKRKFASFVAEKILETGADLVAEEAKHGQENVAQGASNSVGCLYVNIEMPPEERTARCIPPGYNEASIYSPADCEQWNRQREEFMAEKALSAGTGIDRAIVLCGRMHVGPLKDLFEKAGHLVESVDLLDQPWYVEDWFGHIMRL